jgi:hypothetical protein
VNHKHLKELLHASPFVPFSLVLATGKVFRVGNPDVLNVTMQGRVIHEDAKGPSTFINPLLITEIVMTSGAAGGHEA